MTWYATTDDQRLLQRLRDYLDDTLHYIADYDGNGGIRSWAEEEGDTWVLQTRKFLEEINPMIPPPDMADISENGMARAAHKAALNIAIRSGKRRRLMTSNLNSTDIIARWCLPRDLLWIRYRLVPFSELRPR